MRKSELTQTDGKKKGKERPQIILVEVVKRACQLRS